MTVDFLPWHLRWRQRLPALFWTLLLTAALGLLWWAGHPPLHRGAMLFVSDGDSFTLGIDGARRPVRLLGIDAPELHQSCTDARKLPWPCGTAARTALAALAPRGTALDCRGGGQDNFGRTLTRCRFADGRDLGAQLVEQGTAIATTEDYLVEQALARRARAGIWRGDFLTPADWRTANPRSSTPAIPPPF